MRKQKETKKYNEKDDQDSDLLSPMGLMTSSAQQLDFCSDPVKILRNAKGQREISIDIN